MPSGVDVQVHHRQFCKWDLFALHREEDQEMISGSFTQGDGETILRASFGLGFRLCGALHQGLHGGVIRWEDGSEWTRVGDLPPQAATVSTCSLLRACWSTWYQNSLKHAAVYNFLVWAVQILTQCLVAWLVYQVRMKHHKRRAQEAADLWSQILLQLGAAYFAWLRPRFRLFLVPFIMGVGIGECSVFYYVKMFLKEPSGVRDDLCVLEVLVTILCTVVACWNSFQRVRVQRLMDIAGPQVQGDQLELLKTWFGRRDSCLEIVEAFEVPESASRTQRHQTMANALGLASQQDPPLTAWPGAICTGTAWLLHGASVDALASIMQDGYKLPSEWFPFRGMFGQGLYFAEDPAKCELFAQRLADGSFFLLLNTVHLGEPKRMNRAAQGCSQSALRLRDLYGRTFDSVVGLDSYDGGSLSWREQARANASSISPSCEASSRARSALLTKVVFQYLC